MLSDIAQPDPHEPVSKGRVLDAVQVNGVLCYSANKADDYADYPDSGFDLTEETGERSFWVSSRNRLFTFLVTRALARSGGDRLLEVGCGTGDLLRRISTIGRYRITGSEIYAKGLSYAQSKTPGVGFVQYDASEGILPDRFNVIAAFDVLEHIENDIGTMENMFLMLEPGGRVVLSVPQYMFLWSNLDEIVKHKRRYSRHEMLGKLRTCGFEVDRTTSFVFVLFPIMLLSRLFDRASPDQSADDKALEKRVKFSRITNAVFDAIMRIDEVLIRLGLALPFGGTLVVVARKPA